MNSFKPESRTRLSDPTHRLKQPAIQFRTLRLVPLRAARLAQCLARSTLRDLLRPQTTTHHMDDATTPFGVYKFGRAASLRISMSSAWSATSFFKRPFSFSRSFMYLAIFGSIPPYF